MTKYISALGCSDVGQDGILRAIGNRAGLFIRNLAAPVLFVVAATVLSAAHLSGGDQPTVPISALKEVETATDRQFAGDPWQFLGDTRGTYLSGYGAVFTFELSLVQMPTVWPFNPTITPQQKKSVHDRKAKQLPILEQIMRDSIVKAASSLQTLPPSESIVFDAHLLYQPPNEDLTGLPWRVTMTANRQKILDAVANHATPAQLASLIEERKE